MPERPAALWCGSVRNQCQSLQQCAAAGTNEPAQQPAIERHRTPEHRLKRRLARLVPQQPLRQQRPRPAAKQRQQMQRLFPSAPALAPRRVFIPRVDDKGDETDQGINCRKPPPQPPQPYAEQQQPAKQRGKRQRRRGRAGRVPIAFIGKFAACRLVPVSGFVVVAHGWVLGGRVSC